MTRCVPLAFLPLPAAAIAASSLRGLAGVLHHPAFVLLTPEASSASMADTWGQPIEDFMITNGTASLPTMEMSNSGLHLGLN